MSIKTVPVSNPPIAISVKIVEEFVFSRILKLAMAIKSETRRKVILPNSKISCKPPINISRDAVSAIAMSLITMIIGTLLTSPTDTNTLQDFFKKTRPFGFWKHIKNSIPAHILKQVNQENKRDIIATFFAVPWQVVLFLTMMMIVMQRWDTFGWLLGILVFLSAGLYHFWYKNLSTEVRVDELSEYNNK